MVFILSMSIFVCHLSLIKQVFYTFCTDTFTILAQGYGFSDGDSTTAKFVYPMAMYFDSIYCIRCKNVLKGVNIAKKL